MRHADILPINVIFADATGVASSSVSFDTQSVAASSTIDLFFQTLGTHTITAFAQDLVNNATTSSRTIVVVATASSTQSDVARAYALGWIPSNSLKTLLIKQLGDIVKLQTVTTQIPDPSNPKKTTTVTKIVKIVDTILLNTMLAELQLAKVLKQVTPQGYSVLSSDIGWLITHN